MHVEKDFYDIVGVRIYGEVLALRRKRLKDPFTLVGLVDGEFLGFANGRAWDENVLHQFAYPHPLPPRQTGLADVLCQNLLRDGNAQIQRMVVNL